MSTENDHITDSLITAKIRQDDKNAFKLLYDRYSRKIYFFSLKYLGNNYEAEELVQSIFINVWENRKLLDPYNSVKSYIYKAAVNHVYNLLKKRTIHARFIDSQRHGNKSGSEVTDDEVIFHDLEKSIYSVVNTMPSQQQRIFQLSRYEGLTNKEIASKLNISLRTVENQMYRALKKLKNTLKQIYFTFLL